MTQRVCSAWNLFLCITLNVSRVTLSQSYALFFFLTLSLSAHSLLSHVWIFRCYLCLRYSSSSSSLHVTPSPYFCCYSLLHFFFLLIAFRLFAILYRPRNVFISNVIVAHLGIESATKWSVIPIGIGKEIKRKANITLFVCCVCLFLYSFVSVRLLFVSSFFSPLHCLCVCCPKRKEQMGDGSHS